MKLKGRGGKGRGQGRLYSPWGRIWLANRHAELKWQFRNKRKPAYEAYFKLHAEEHPDGGGSVETTKRLVITGRHEEIFLDELQAKIRNREPLTDFEQSVLRARSRRWQRISRRWRERNQR